MINLSAIHIGAGLEVIRAVKVICRSAVRRAGGASRELIYDVLADRIDVRRGNLVPIAFGHKRIVRNRVVEGCVRTYCQIRGKVAGAFRRGWHIIRSG